MIAEELRRHLLHCARRMPQRGAESGVCRGQRGAVAGRILRRGQGFQEAGNKPQCRDRRCPGRQREDRQQGVEGRFGGKRAAAGEPR